MNIIKWLAPSLSAVTGKALIEVESGEVADIERMLVLIDGDSVGHFGLRAELVSTKEPPEIIPARYGGKPIGAGYYDVRPQFGYGTASYMKKYSRYYKVLVNRD